MGELVGEAQETEVVDNQILVAVVVEDHYQIVQAVEEDHLGKFPGLQEEEDSQAWYWSCQFLKKRKRTILQDTNLAYRMELMGGGMEEGGGILMDYWIIRALQHE